MITLSHQDPIASGSSRLVFQHPLHPDLLVKVLKSVERPTAFSVKHSFRMLEFQFKIRRMSREYQQFRNCLDHPEHPLHLHVPQTVDWVESDLGPAMAVEKLTDEHGHLLPSLRQLARGQKLQSEHLRATETFIDRLVEATETVVGDINMGNLIPTATGVAEEPIRIVVVDGLGDSTLIPVQHWFSSINKTGKSQRISKLRNKLLQKIRQSG